MKYELDLMIKGQQWEITKGHLRALVHMQGSYVSEGSEPSRKFTELSRLVENFINEVEDNEYNF